MAWRTVEISEQRFRFVAAASRGGATVASLCSEFGDFASHGLFVG